VTAAAAAAGITDSAKRLLNLIYTARHTHVAEKLLTFTATRQCIEVTFVQQLHVTLDHVSPIILLIPYFINYNFTHILTCL
jgi:hypothetical protein